MSLRSLSPILLALLVAPLHGCGNQEELTGPSINPLDAPVSTAHADLAALGPGHDVDVSLLVPLLSPTFTNWKCVATGTGPVCRGERLTDTGWEPTDFPCVQPVYHHFVQYRAQTRYYDENYRNFFRRFRQDTDEYFSLSPSGADAVLISDRLNFTETYLVAGDDGTRSIKSEGLLFQLKDTRGGVILQWSGANLEPFDGDPEIIGGNVNSVKSFVKSFTDNPEAFLAATCEALGTKMIS